MKIVVLDGFVANNGDLSWDEIAGLGEFTAYDRTMPDMIVERAADADVIFTNKVVIDKDLLDKLPKLKFIGVLATGYNNVDVVAARRRGVTVTNVPADSTHSVVQNIFAHLLNIANETALHNDSVKKGGWTHCQDFSYRLTPIIELSGLTMGIYGLGSIGSEVTKIANAFGMKVIAFTSKVPWQLPGYISPVEKDELFAQSDVLVLSAPLTSENKHIVNADTLRLMKKSAIIINAARGGLMDSAAVAEALNRGDLYAVGADVLESEPPTPSDPLVAAPKCRITPHIAWQSGVAREALIRISADNLRSYLSGKPKNVVN
ncbi:MAG: D-2-hydroxyacid dehydrogenase [Muribaculaceae bacterium]|nr:D-2-hydroxyacid dehydrogenase [Muribaculaceae bacterium]